MAILSSEVVITGKDAGVAAMFERIGKKLDAMGKAAKISPEFDKLAGALGKARAQAEAIEKFQSGRSAFADARAKFNASRQAVEQYAKAMRETEAPTRQMAAEYKRLQAGVTKNAEAFEKAKMAMLDAKHAAESFGMPLSKLASEQIRLRGVIDQTTKAVEHQAAAERHAADAAAKSHADALTRHAAAEKALERRNHFMAHHGLAGTLFGAAAGAVGIHSVLGVGEKAWEAGAERQHVITGMRTAGMPQEEIERAQALAEIVSRQAPNMSTSQIMELHKEARSAVQHPEEVFELMPQLARAASVLKGMGAENANIADLVKGGESLGLMNDPKRFHGFLEGQVKAMQVMGKTITTEQIYEAAKYSKATGSTLSDEFLNLTLPSLIQEMHGSSAGDALSSLSKRLRGGMMHQHVATDRLNQMGLLEDPSKIKRSKSGEIIGYEGKVKGDALLTSDPGQWFQTFFKEGAAKVGAKSLADINKLLAETLPSTAANLGRIFIQQEETLAQHRRNYDAATGLEETVERQREDWNAATMAFKSSLEDLGASVTGVNMGRAAKGLSWLSDEIKGFAKVAADHPYIAVPTAVVATGGAAIGAGYLGWQFMTAGTALQTSATMLDEAAVRLGASPLKSIVPSAATAVEAGVAGAEGGAVVGGGVGLAAGLGTAGVIGGLAWLIKASQDAQRAGRGGAWAPATFETRDLDEDALAEQRVRLAQLQARANRTRAASKFPDMPNPVLQQIEDEVADLQNQIAARETSLARVPKYPIGPMSDGNSPTMLGFDVGRRRKGDVTLPDVPMIPTIGGNGFLSGASPYGVGAPAPTIGAPIDIRPPAQRDGMAGPMEVKADVTSHVETAFTNRIEIVAAPGIEARQTFQSQATRVSTGPSMPNAGAAPHVARRDE